MRLLIASFAVALLASVGCSGGSNSVTGTVGGKSLSAQDAVFSAGGSSTTGTVVGIASFGNVCSDITNMKLPGNSVALSLQLVDNGGVVSSPGTFDLIGATSGSTKVFGANWDAFDATCNGTSVDATAGTVTVTAVSASQLAGTFDLTFGTDHVTGSFSASSCPALATSSGVPTCM